MQKVKLFDRRVLRRACEISGTLTAVLSAVLMFSGIPENYKIPGLLCFLLTLLCVYFFVWVRANRLKKINLKIERNDVVIKVGNIFDQQGLKAIAFNEYFDTQVDDVIIAKRSLNGIFINRHLDLDVASFDRLISNDEMVKTGIVGIDTERKQGKTKKYRLGTIYKHNKFLLTAFSKFDERNRAVLTVPEYMGFLGNFWINANALYAQDDISVTIFGSGITRIENGNNISDEDLLTMMLVSLKVSGVRFAHPSALTIVIHKEKIEKINLFNVKNMFRGVALATYFTTYSAP